MGVLLLLRAYAYDDEDGEEARPVIDIGYWSPKINSFICIDGNAFEENFEMDAYHIIHDLDGQPWTTEN